MTDDEQTSGITLLVDWANSRDHWVRSLVAAVLDARRGLSEDVIRAFYELLLREKELVDTEGEPVSVPAIQHDGNSGDPEKALRLTALSDVANVNALAADQDILFHPRMTLLYGENGAGKTGYVRILKRLAAVRTVEAILPNIARPDATEAPSASITFEIGDTPDSFVWAGEEGVPPFTQIDVFDAPSVDLHVDGELTYIYTPSELAVFRYTHDGIEAVKAMLEKARKDTLPTGNPYLNKFSREGTLYAKIETLGSTTDLSELEALANVPKEERAQLGPLQERVDALRSGTSAAKLQVAETERDLFKRVAGALTTAEAFDLVAYAQALAALRTAEKAHTHATQEALAGETIPGVLEETWRDFIEAGEVYLSEHRSETYPEDGDACPYCLQDLGAAAIALVQKYRTFCRSDLQDAITEARTALDDLIRDVQELDLEQLAQDIEKRIDAVGEEAAPEERLVLAGSFITECRTLQETVGKGEDLKLPRLQGAIQDARPLVDTRLTDLKNLLENLRAQVDKQDQLLATETAKLRVLQDRITLSELFPGIRDHVAKAKWASRAKIILGSFPALSRSLTETSKLASEQLLNHDFEATFTDECKALRAPPVTLEFPGRKGQPARRKSLTPHHRLSAILSEGEKKVIALADFIAEATLRLKLDPTGTRRPDHQPRLQAPRIRCRSPRRTERDPPDHRVHAQHLVHHVGARPLRQPKESLHLLPRLRERPRTGHRIGRREPQARHMVGREEAHQPTDRAHPAGGRKGDA